MCCLTALIPAKMEQTPQEAAMIFTSGIPLFSAALSVFILLIRINSIILQFYNKDYNKFNDFTFYIYICIF